MRISDWSSDVCSSDLGISAFGLAQNLAIPQGEARAYIDAYFQRYPSIRAYMEAMKKEARERGFVTTLFGRRIHVPGIKDKNPAMRSFSERSEEHTSELQSLMRISYAVFCLKKKKT